jgi:predicted AlkP superfamily pyrophosphatase or phosphodiesterase
MKYLLCTSLIYSLSISAFSQSHEKPKLVVGIVIDQMRFDYLYKYSEKYGNEGFRKLINEGFQCKNLQYNYVPTYTGPGHSSIYTGTTPERHGIIANDWYSRDKKALIYCTEDQSVSTVGSTTLKVGQMSPRNLLSTTVGDELRIASNKRSKVIGIALKDRGAILPAGHLADAAYWFDGESGNWVSSTFYQSTIPAWLVDFNAQQKAKSYLNQTWRPLLPIDQYTESLPDQNTYETPFKGTTSTSFPYDLKDLMEKNGGLNLIRSTPFGNSFTKDLAIETIRSENLGMDEFTDLLCVSFSSPDYIGHQFGPDAIETEDCYLRLDNELAELFAFCDKQVGKGNFMVFLTADHGGATVPAYLIEQRAPGGYLDSKPIKDSISVWLKQISKSEDWLLEYVNEQVYLNEKKIINSGKSVEATELFLAGKLPFFQGIRSVTTASFLKKQGCTEGSLKLVQKGFHPKRSGNVMLTLEPNWMEFSKTGTTHGSPYSYDTRVPMLWYGWKIEHGESVSPYFVDDIASTLSWILNIPFPNANSGNPIPLPIKN